jgi:hypothetical protein
MMMMADDGITTRFLTSAFDLRRPIAECKVLRLSRVGILKRAVS